MYRLPRTNSRTGQGKPSSSESKPSNQQSNNAYELLWRKKSTKMHKTWEGDAIGILRTSGPQLMLEIQADGRKLGSVKIETTNLDEGRILSSNSYEFEVGASINHLPHREQTSPPAASTKSLPNFRSPIIRGITTRKPVTNIAVTDIRSTNDPKTNNAWVANALRTTNIPLTTTTEENTLEVPNKAVAVGTVTTNVPGDDGLGTANASVTTNTLGIDSSVATNRLVTTNSQENDSAEKRNLTILTNISGTNAPGTGNTSVTTSGAYASGSANTSVTTNSSGNTALEIGNRRNSINTPVSKGPIPTTSSVSSGPGKTAPLAISSGAKRRFPLYAESSGGRFKTPFKTPLKVHAPLSLSNWEIDPQLLQHLRPHQVAGVEFIINSVLGKQHRHGNGCILADEMGLGKTLTSIAAVHTLLKYKHIQNALIVCPVTLIANWKAEFARWLPPHRNPQFGVLAVDQNGLGNSSLKDPVLRFFSDRQFKSFQVMVIGYERVRLILPQLSSLDKRFDLVVCDEGHRLKTTNSKTTDAIEQCCDDKRVILSGTPIQNDLSEFWALAHFVNPGMFGSEATFNRKYAAPMSSEKTVDAKRDEAIEELMEICDDFMLRRDVSVVEKYVNVPKSEYVVFCRPTARQAHRYQQTVDSVSNGLFEGIGGLAGNIDQGACLQAINELRKIAAGDKQDHGGKLQFLGNLLDSLRHQSPEEKIVIVSGSTRVLDLCQDLCISKRVSWVRLDGSTPQEKRQSSVQMFNKYSANACCAFLLSSRSGGMGLNLIGGSRLVLLDCDWNPAIDAQVMGRIHRDGQKRPCFIYRLLTTGSIDEKMFQRQLSKINLSQHILVTATANTTPDFSREMLRDLFRFSVPEKCSTLETSFHGSVSIKGYTETTTDQDPILADACSNSGNVSCLFIKQQR